MKKIFLLAGVVWVHFFSAVQSAGNGMQQVIASPARPIYLWVDARSERGFRIAEQALALNVAKRLSSGQIRQTYIYCGMPMTVHDQKYRKIMNILAGVMQGSSNNISRAVSFDDDSIIVTEFFDH